MNVRVSIYLQSARRLQVFSVARVDAPRMQSPLNQRKCSQTQVGALMVPLPSAHITERVLKGVTRLVGAGRDRKTPVQGKNRKSFGHTTSNQG